MESLSLNPTFIAFQCSIVPTRVFIGIQVTTLALNYSPAGFVGPAHCSSDRKWFEHVSGLCVVGVYHNKCGLCVGVR